MLLVCIMALIPFRLLTVGGLPLVAYILLFLALPADVACPECPGISAVAGVPSIAITAPAAAIAFLLL
jgi:hypothetical protein